MIPQMEIYLDEKTMSSTDIKTIPRVGEYYLDEGMAYRISGVFYCSDRLIQITTEPGKDIREISELVAARRFWHDVATNPEAHGFKINKASI